MRRTHTLATVLVAAGCAALLSCGRRPEPATPFADGLPRREFPQGVFVYDVKALGQHLRGRVTIQDTLVLLEPIEDSCVRVPNRPSGARVELAAFRCQGLPVSGMRVGQPSTILSINLRYPESRSTWSRIERIRVVDAARQPDPRNCLRWGETRRGTPVCTLYDSTPSPNRSREVPVWENGALPLMQASVFRADTTRQMRREAWPPS